MASTRSRRGGRRPGGAQLKLSRGIGFARCCPETMSSRVRRSRRVSSRGQKLELPSTLRSVASQPGASQRSTTPPVASQPHLLPTPQTSGAASSSAACSGRRGRGPSKATRVRNLPAGHTLPVALVGGSAVGVNGKDFTTYMGVLNKSHCNLWQQNYAKLPAETKEAILQDLVQHFNFVRSTAVDRSILRHMGEMQRNYRSYLKKKFFLGKLFEDACAAVPPKIDASQWQRMCEIWIREDQKKIADRNRANRSHLTVSYKKGRTNIHQLNDDFRKTQSRRPTRPEVFQMSQSRTQADGSVVWSSEQSRATMDQMMRLMTPTLEGSGVTDRVLTPEEAFIQVMGRDNPGRIRCGGRGETLMTWYGSSQGGTGSSYHDLLDQQSQFQSEIEHLKATIEQQQGQIATQHTDMQSQMQTQIAAIRAEMQVEMARQVQEAVATAMKMMPHRSTLQSVCEERPEEVGENGGEYEEGEDEEGETYWDENDC